MLREWYLLLTAVLSIAVTVIGCGSSEGGNSPQTSALLGLYTVDSWVANEEGCDYPSETLVDVENDETMLLVHSCTTSLFGLTSHNLKADFCDSPEDCESKRCKPGSFSISFSGFHFVEGNDSDGWSASQFFSFRSGDDPCQGTEITSVLRESEDGQVQLRKHFVNSLPYEEDSDGHCGVEDWEPLFAGQPCSKLEVITFTNDEK